MGSFGIGDATSGQGHTHINIEDVYLTADNTTGIVRGQSGSTVGRVSHVLERGTPANTTDLLTAGTARISLNVQEISTNTVYNIPAGTELNLFANQLTGATVGGGTVNVTTP